MYYRQIMPLLNNYFIHLTFFLLAIFVSIESLYNVAFFEFFSINLMQLLVSFPPAFILQFGGGSCSSESDSASGSSDNCGSGCGSSDCGGGGECASTPFLIGKSKHGQDFILNDIMMGNPSSLFSNRRTGEVAFASGNVGYDVYPVPISLLKEKDTSTIELALKEIEPEQSIIHDFQYGFITLPPNKNLAIENSHQKLYCFSAIENVTSSINHSTLGSVENVFLDNKKACFNQKDYQDKSVFLKQGERVSFTVSEAEGINYISIGAFWRELLSKKYYVDRLKNIDTSTENKIATNVLGFKLKNLMTTAMSIILFMLPFSLSVNDSSLVGKCNINTTQASHPGRSLYLYYRDKNGQLIYFSIIHPRHILTYNTLIRVPAEAYVDGHAQIVIEATQDHYIYSLGIAQEVEEISLPNFTPIEGLLNGEKLLSAQNNKPLETRAGDVFSFSIPLPNVGETHMVCKIHGHYSPLAPLSDADMRSWWSKLSKEEKALYAS